MTDKTISATNNGKEQENKRFQGWLVLDWRDKKMRVRKAKLDKVKPFEIQIRIDIVLKLPKQPEIVAKGEFEIGQTKVNEMFMESI